jgi:hypothetical protein
LLRYYNVGGITEEEMAQLAREAGVEPWMRGDRHPVVRIEHDGKSAEIDEEIAPLVLELWRASLWDRLVVPGRPGPCTHRLRGLGDGGGVRERGRGRAQ